MWGLRKDELSMSWQFPNPNPLLSQLHHSLGVAVRCHVLCKHVWELVDELWNLCRCSLKFIKFCQIIKITTSLQILNCPFNTAYMDGWVWTYYLLTHYFWSIYLLIHICYLRFLLHINVTFFLHKKNCYPLPSK